jgi:hypothetical protein
MASPQKYDKEEMRLLTLLEQTGLLRTLVLVAERDRFITELKHSAVNPNGIGSVQTIWRVRDNLVELGLIQVIEEEGPRAKKFLRITPKGTRFVRWLKKAVKEI